LTLFFRRHFTGVERFPSVFPFPEMFTLNDIRIDVIKPHLAFGMLPTVALYTVFLKERFHLLMERTQIRLKIATCEI
jgi:hypothetical protein